MSKPTSTIIDQNIDSDLGLLLIKYKRKYLPVWKYECLHFS